MAPKRAFAGWGHALWPWLVLVAAAAAHAQPLLCDYCRRVITGPYLVYEGRNLHERCYYDHYARYCGICGAALSGQYLTNSWGDAVCAVHLGQYPTCEYCDRLVAEPLTGRGAHYPDGRNVCGHCESSAVADVREAYALLDTVKQELRLWGIEIDRELELVPIDKLRMLDVNSAIGKEAWGYTDFKQTVSLFGLMNSEQITIYMLSRLPRTVFLGVLAHELMHVWLYANAPADMDPGLTEGSCEYAAHLVLQNRPDPYVKFLEEAREASDDLVYGTGFRSVRDYAKQVGVPAWLGYLKGHSGPPW
jgi:hypothetical protein